MTDSYWISTTHPCLTYGLRGCSYYEIIVEGPKDDLHSGIFGGVVHEPLVDMTNLLSKLVDTQGKLMIPGVYDMVAPLTPEEDALYDDIHFGLEDVEQLIGAKTTISTDIKTLLQDRWRNPSLSVHGIEGAFHQPGAKTVIPARVSGKFSIRTVANMDPKKLDQLVYDHVKAEFTKLKSKNTMTVQCNVSGDYWVADPNNWAFRAAKKATKKVWGVEPDMVREGGSIPIILILQEILQSSVVMIPVGRGDDAAHSTGEKLNVSNYIKGAKTLCAYLYYMAEEQKD